MRQECILSPILFNTYTEFIWDALESFDKVEGADISYGGHHLSNLRYVDDMTLFATMKYKKCWSL